MRMGLEKDAPADGTEQKPLQGGDVVRGGLRSGCPAQECGPQQALGKHSQLHRGVAGSGSALCLKGDSSDNEKNMHGERGEAESVEGPD